MARTESLRSHLRSRGTVRGFVGSVAVGAAIAATPPPEPTLDGLAAMLGTHSGTAVDVATLTWEPPRNVLVELAFGRRVWFVAAPRAGGPRDVYRAAVRLAPGGQPLSVARVTNFSDTPDADEFGLALEDGVASFATVAFGNVRAVTAIDVGNGAPQRTDIVIEVPAHEATLARGAGALTVRLEGREDDIRYDVARRVLTSAPGVAHAAQRTPTSKGIVLATSDTARRLFGDRTMHVLATFGRVVRDAIERAAHAVVFAGRRPEPRDVTRAHVEDVKRARRPTDVWPPPNVPPRFAPAEPGEGVFRPLAKRGPEPHLYRTFVRPDDRRPYARAVVVAMDMRQLELTMVAGRDVPKAGAGPQGEGRLRNDAKLARLVAVVSAGLAGASARFGMASEGRLLNPPEPNGIAITELANGETLVGRWPFGPALPDTVVSFRQGLESLLDEKGSPIELRRTENDAVRPRSGLCATPAGHLYYAFGARLDRRSLASTFAQSGCAAAIELGGGAEPAGMALVEKTAGRAPHFETVDAEMSFDAAQVLTGSSRDFIALWVRDTQPRLPEGVTWQPAAGAQPLPAWLTGIYSTRVALGGLTIELHSFENGRVEWLLRPGRREPGARGESWAGVLPEGAVERALATLELGHTTVTPRLGLALGTTTPITLKDAFATLVLAPAEPPRILAPGEKTKLDADEQAVQLPLLADSGGLTERARERGDLRMRAVLGVTRTGRVLVGLLKHDSSDPLAVTLRNAGAERVVELDRGSHHPAFVHRAGTETPPAANYDSTTLWALGRPMLPGARVPE